MTKEKPKCTNCKLPMNLRFSFVSSWWECPKCGRIRPNPKGTLGYV